MTTLWIAALIVVGLVISVAKTVMSGVLREEAQTRLNRIPEALIRLASARVPADLRDDLAAEWNAELEFVLSGTDSLPLTRLARGIRYSGRAANLRRRDYSRPQVRRRPLRRGASNS